MASKNGEKKELQKITNASKIQDGLSFKDRLRQSMQSSTKEQSAKTEVVSEVPKESANADPAATQQEKPLTEEIDAAPAEIAEHEEIKNEQPSQCDYKTYLAASEDVSFLVHMDKVLEIEDDISALDAQENISFAFGIEKPDEEKYKFEELRRVSTPLASERQEQTASQEMQPKLQEKDQSFGQAWLHSLPSRFSYSSDNASNPRASAGPEGTNRSAFSEVPIGGAGGVTQAARKDAPARQPNPYAPRNKRGFFGHMIPPAYPPVPPAFDYHSQYQVPYHHNPVPPPSQPSVPPGYPTPYFMGGMHPQVRQDKSNSGNMYGVPPMGYGMPYHMNFGSH